MAQGQPEEISCFRYPDRPTFFQKRQKKKKKRGRGFQMASCSYALFFATLYLLRKDGRGLVIVRRPTDLQLRETVGIPETRYFFWLAQGVGHARLILIHLLHCFKNYSYLVHTFPSLPPFTLTYLPSLAS